MLNGIEAMADSEPGQRRLEIRSANAESGHVLVAVEDLGPGLDLAQGDQLFEAFFTTKPDGMGMGLSICRSIIDAHGGRLWASPRNSTKRRHLPVHLADRGRRLRQGGRRHAMTQKLMSCALRRLQSRRRAWLNDDHLPLTAADFNVSEGISDLG